MVCLRVSAGDIWGFIYADRLSPLACYSPADGADHAEECSKLHYFADKDRLFEVKAVFCFVVYCLGVVCDYLRNQRETLGFLLCGLTEYSCMLFSRRLRRSRRRMQQAALLRRERQLGVVHVVLWLFEVYCLEFIVLRFGCEYLRDLRETLWFLVCRLIEYACVLFSRR